MNRLTVLVSTFLALIVFTDAAQAAFISNIFEPVATDASVQQLLRPMFGGLVDAALGSGDGGNATILTRVIKFELEFIVVPFGGLLLLYSLYHGLSVSAMSGELYGDKKSAYYIAARTVIGFAMVTPASGLKGLALGNLFLMWLTLSGVGAASSLWNVVVDEVTKNPIIMTNNSPNTELFDTMLLGEVCAAIYKDAVTEAGENDVPVDQLKTWSILRNDSQQTRYGWIKPESGGGGNSDGGCGHVNIDRAADIGVDANIPGTSYQLGSIKAAQIANKSAQAEMQSQTDAALKTLQAKAHEVAESVIDTGNVIGARPPPVESYFALMEWFKGQQQQAAKSIADSAMTDVAKTFKADAKQEGWVTAGFYFLGLSTFQQAINHAVSMSWVTGTPTNINRVKGLIADETWHAKAGNEWILMQGYINAGHQQIEAGRSLPATVTDLGNPVSNKLAMMGKWLNNVVKDSIDSKATPLAATASLGSSLVDYAEVAVAGAAVAGVASFIPVIGSAAGSAGIGLVLAGSALYALGQALLFICLLPAFAWCRRILHWIIRAAVAQVAGPMWFILHVHHAGDGLEGSAGNGYRLALQLVFAPMLDITALAIVYVLMVVFSAFMNATIMPLLMQMGGAGLSLGGIIFTTLANVWLVFELLALFEKIEHEVLAFVGGRGSDLSMDSQGSDKNRTMALLAFINRKTPMPNLGGKKDNNSGDGGGASSTKGKGGNWEDLKKTPKIPTSKLLPRDK